MVGQSEPRYRRCIVDGKTGLFHEWVQWDDILVDPSGEYRDKVRTIHGLVEFYDGTVTAVSINDIRFIDDLKKYYTEGKNVIVEPKKEAHWTFWSGWKGNHDRRIEDATCSNCGYEHPTVYGRIDMLAQICPRCGSCMASTVER